MSGLRMSAAQWEAVRVAYSRGEPAKSLAARFPVSVSRIYGRASEQHWRDRVSQSAAKEVK